MEIELIKKCRKAAYVFSTCNSNYPYRFIYIVTFYTMMIILRITTCVFCSCWVSIFKNQGRSHRELTVPYRVHTNRMLIFPKNYMLPADYPEFLEKRLDRRGRKLLSSLFKGMSSSIQQISIDRAEQIVNYRFLNNSNVGESVLIEEQKQRRGQLSAGKKAITGKKRSKNNYGKQSIKNWNKE